MIDTTVHAQLELLLVDFEHWQVVGVLGRSIVRAGSRSVRGSQRVHPARKQVGDVCKGQHALAAQQRHVLLVETIQQIVGGAGLGAANGQ